MLKHQNFVYFFKSIVFLPLFLSVLTASPLDDYVNQPDPHYSYKLLAVYDNIGYKVVVLNMTSQKWLDETFTTNPIWWHYLCITVPDKITRPDTGFIFIDGGSNKDS